jgi:hypothetical protein
MARNENPARCCATSGRVGAPTRGVALHVCQLHADRFQPLCQLTRALRGALTYADDIPNLIPFLGLNVEITLLTPLLTAVGLALGAMVG